jgi:hypothetical protein
MNLTDNKSNIDTLGVGGLIKTIVLIVVGAAFALGFSWFFRTFLLGGEWMQLVWSSACAIGFLVVFTLQTFFIRATSLFALAFFLQSVALLGFFITLTIPVIALFCVAYGLLFSASYAGRKVLENSLKIDFWNISKLIVPKGIIVITLLISVFIPLYLQAHRDTLPLSLATFDKVLSSSNVFVQRFYKDFDPSKSVEEIARTATEQQLAAMPQAQTLKPNEKALVVKAGMKEFYTRLFGYTGVQINPKDSVSKTLYGVLEKKFGALKDEAKLWVFIIVGSIVFISIASIMMPIRIVVALLAYFCYEVMVALGFARITIEQKSKETIILD